VTLPAPIVQTLKNIEPLLSGKFLSILLELGREDTVSSVCSPSNLYGCFYLANFEGTEITFKSLISKSFY